MDNAIGGMAEVWRRTFGLNRSFSARRQPVRCGPEVPAVALAVAARSGAGDRFALAIGALPMLETARIGGDAGSL